ncbi:hypothetical protein AVEN_150904-1 [Araneus ventricosus]|uniref:Uncharacterized protein n=1 Tax=Araneus ventricosus TaxID=182803 RepID=A0A4Y2CA44_ARAVE|nr:hypothetical protein AVEN_150904-1 [Araneus ventricosus]
MAQPLPQEVGPIIRVKLDGLKPSEILGEENVKVCNNNDVVVDKNILSCSTPRRRLKLATFARTYDKYGLADPPAAALASALLHDLSYCSPSFGLQDYVVLKNWQQCEVTESPLTRGLTEDSCPCVEESSSLFALICDLLCHTQIVKDVRKQSLRFLVKYEEVLPETLRQSKNCR